MFCLTHKVLNELGRKVLVMKRVSVKHQWTCDMDWCLAVSKIERKDTKKEKMGVHLKKTTQKNERWLWRGVHIICLVSTDAKTE